MNNGSNQPRLVTGSRSAREGELRRLVAAWRSADPLGPITIVVPNRATGDRVVELVTADGGVVVGLEVRTLEEHARWILERSDAAGGLGLPPGGRQLLVRGLLAGAEAPSELAGLADRPGLLAAVGAGLRDLVDAGLGDLDAGSRAVAGPLGDLHAAHLARRAALRIDDDSSRFERAAAAVAGLPGGRLAVFGVYDPTGLQERFLAACLAAAGEPVVLAPEHGRPLAERLGCGLGDAPLTVLGDGADEERPALEFHSVPGGLAGARLVARHLRDLLADSDLAPGDLACVHRGAGGVLPDLLAAELARFGVPVAGGEQLGDVAPGPFLMVLGRVLARSRVSRSELLDALALAPGLAPEALSRWDRLTRDAELRLLVGPEGASSAALSRLTWQGKLLAETEDPERQARLASLAPLLDLLKGFGRLHHALREGGTWASFGRRLAAFLGEHGLLEPAVEDPWSEHLAALGGLDHLDLPADPLGLSAVLSELAARPVPEAAAGDGVAIGSLGRSRGGRWRRVVLLDGDEGSFPRRAPVDPLLDDERRGRLASLAPALAHDEEAEERALLAELLDLPAEGLLLCTTRGGLEGKAARGPSRFLLELLAEARGGQAPTLEQLAKGEVPEVCHHGLAELWSGPPQAARCAEDAALFAATAGLEPAAVRALLAGHAPDEAPRADLEQARADRPGATAYDGHLAGTPAHEALLASGALRGRGRNLSASTLEAYAGCGMRSLLQRWLGLAEHEEPEAQRGLDARERGKAVHSILEDFGEATKQQGLVPWRAAERKRLDELLAAAITTTMERIRRASAPEDRALWEAEEPRYEGLLGRWLGRQLEEGRTAWQPDTFEWAFEGFEYALPEGPALQLAGRVDRVDRAADDSGRVRVVDYKTGGTGGVKDDTTGGGRRLQAHLYGRAARALFGASGSVGLYDHVLVGQEVAWSGADKRSGKDDALRIENDDAAVREVAALVGGMEAGHFEPLPRKERRPDRTGCDYCPMAEACGPWRSAVQVAGADEDPVLAALDRAVLPVDPEQMP